MPSDSDLYLPIHVGREGKDDIGYIGDNTGENISSFNSYYSELTGLYWACKNLDCDFLGLVHYRRYFTTVSKKYSENIDIDEVVLNREQIELLLKNYQVIVPKKRKYYIETLSSHYAHTLDETHLPITRSIIEKNSPEYLNAFDEVLAQRSGYMFNMFIMPKNLVNDYCNWLFPILDKVFEQVDKVNLTSFEARFPGRISEILFNVWLKENDITPTEVNFMYLERVDLKDKIISFLKAKFLGKKYGQSF